MLALGKPVVIFLLNGGSVAVAPELATGAAMIDAFYPGAEGAQALANTLFGKSNRLGKMPYSVMPADWVNTNSMLQMDVAKSKRTYRYGADSLVPFGAGLSLSTFKLSLSGSQDKKGLRMSTAERHVQQKIEVAVSNAGKLKGDEVLQLYLVPKSVPLPQHPIKTLVDFKRLRDIAAGGKATATFAVAPEQLLLATAAGNLDSVPGSYELRVENGAGEVLTTPLTITGNQVTHVPFPTVPKPE